VARGGVATACKDLGRLAARCRVCLGPPPAAAVVFDGGSPAALVAALVAALRPAAGESDDADAAALHAALQAAADTGGGLDEHAAARVFEALGPAAPAARVLRLVTQAAVLAAMLPLRTTLAALPQWRDLRERHGWLVEIIVGPDTVGVTHRRTELLASGGGGPEPAGTLSWIVAATLDRATASHVLGSALRVVELAPAPGVPAATVARWRAAVPDGGCTLQFCALV
jgi:hypothetical protein